MFRKGVDSRQFTSHVDRYTGGIQRPSKRDGRRGASDQVVDLAERTDGFDRQGVELGLVDQQIALGGAFDRRSLNLGSRRVELDRPLRSQTTGADASAFGDPHLRALVNGGFVNRDRGARFQSIGRNAQQDRRCVRRSRRETRP